MANEESSAATLQEMREELLKTNPSFLAQCEVGSDKIIKAYGGEAGKVFLLFLALRISAMAEKDEF